MAIASRLRRRRIPTSCGDRTTAPVKTRKTSERTVGRDFGPFRCPRPSRSSPRWRRSIPLVFRALRRRRPERVKKDRRPVLPNIAKHPRDKMRMPGRLGSDRAEGGRQTRAPEMREKAWRRGLPGAGPIRSPEHRRNAEVHSTTSERSRPRFRLSTPACYARKKAAESNHTRAVKQIEAPAQTKY